MRMVPCVTGKFTNMGSCRCDIKAACSLTASIEQAPSLPANRLSGSDTAGGHSSHLQGLVGGASIDVASHVRGNVSHGLDVCGGGEEGSRLTLQHPRKISAVLQAGLKPPCSTLIVSQQCCRQGSTSPGLSSDNQPGACGDVMLAVQQGWICSCKQHSAHFAMHRHGC